MRLRLEFEASWDKRKIEIVSIQLRRDLVSYGGVSEVSRIVPADASAATPAPPRLKLVCTNNSFGKKCGSEWEAEVMTPCPKCNQRRYVHKAEEIPAEVSA